MADRDSGEDPIKKTMIVGLTVVFVALYVGAILGWGGLGAQVNVIQPIVYVIIGYFFGRMPSEKNEKALREDAKDKEQKAEVARTDADQAKSKLGAVRRILSAAGAGGGSTATGIAPTLSHPVADPVVLQERVQSALKAIDE